MGISKRFVLTGKAALVTGAARNIGRAYAEALAEAGACVCVADIDRSAAERTAGEIRELYGVDTLAAAMDVSDPISCAAAAERAAERFGRIDICVANAGIYSHADAGEMPTELWERILSVNLSGAYYSARAAFPYMKDRGGAVIFTASIAGHSASRSSCCAYDASKGGVIALTRSLASEWGAYGIRVNCISPGNLDTDILSPLWREAHQKECEEATILGRLGTAKELTGALLLLASDAGSYITGTDIVADGGYLAK